MAKVKVPKIEKLLEAGVHFGHQVRRWHPKMEPYIFTQRSGIHIIDLEDTHKKLEEACEFLKEVAADSRIKKKDVARCYRLLLRELDIKMPVEDPIRCVSKIASKADISMKTQRGAIKILKEAQRRGIAAGKDPMGLAAAALYVACVLEGEKKTQKDIAEVANVTEVTVRNRYKGLKEALGLNV